jgi:serine/threonine protein kinase
MQIQRVKHYKIEKVLGEGAFGMVQLAVHEATGEKVAIKMLLKDGEKYHDELEEVKIMQVRRCR